MTGGKMYVKLAVEVQTIQWLSRLDSVSWSLQPGAYLVIWGPSFQCFNIDI